MYLHKVSTAFTASVHADTYEITWIMPLYEWKTILTESNISLIIYFNMSVENNCNAVVKMFKKCNRWEIPPLRMLFQPCNREKLK